MANETFLRISCSALARNRVNNGGRKKEGRNVTVQREAHTKAGVGSPFR